MWEVITVGLHDNEKFHVVQENDRIRISIVDEKGVHQSTMVSCTPDQATELASAIYSLLEFHKAKEINVDDVPF